MLINYLLSLPLFVCFCLWSLFCYVKQNVLSSFAIILLRNRGLYCNCLTVSVLWLFLTVPWVGLRCVMVVFPGQAYLLLALSRPLSTFVQTNIPRAFCLFDLILHVPSTIFQLNRDGSSWIEPLLS